MSQEFLGGTSKNNFMIEILRPHKSNGKVPCSWDQRGTEPYRSLWTSDAWKLLKYRIETRWSWRKIVYELYIHKSTGVDNTFCSLQQLVERSKRRSEHL